MKNILYAFLPFSIAMITGCTVSPEEAEPELAQGEDIAEASSEVNAPRACVADSSCNQYLSCVCSAGYCQEGGFGAGETQPDCSAPPKRSCSAAKDCRSGCGCSGGACAGNANLNCYLPPPDAYEYDDQFSSWKAYGGPQQHTLSSSTDVDWVAVWMGSAGTVVFETTPVNGYVDTYMKVYGSTPSGSLGALVGSNDDKCGQYWVTNCVGSKLTVNVPANSAYFVQVSTKAKGLWNDYNAADPTYNLTIKYQ